MSSAGLIVSLVLAALVLVFVLAPLFRRRPSADANSSTDRQRARVQAYYDRALANLRDLDEDFALGKIEPSLYEQDRALWVERGVQALKALDTLGALPPDTPSKPPAGPQDTGSAIASETDLDAAIDDAVEAAVRRARSQTSGTR